ncbi:MAG: WYL domain-containing protein [Oscillospiraceae bacterium]|nr:WYL domain-containing protein [Oscillospiraceae bacterium]
MAKSPNQKQKLLLIKRYLEENTDEEHPVTTAQIIAYLGAQGVAAERKAVYDDLETLTAFGVDLMRERRGNRTVWYVASREFQLPELRLLVDSVQSSRFLTRRKSLELIGKIESLASVHQARGLRRQVWVKNRIKSMNESIYYLVDDLHAAIDADEKIRFHYFQYDPRRERQLRHGGAWYEISPYALMWDSENYYLVGYDSAAGIIKHFRVDKIVDLRRTGERRDGAEAFAGVDMSAYANAHFGMFSGAMTNVRMEFDNALAGAVIDRFGTEAVLVPAGEGRFSVTVPVAVTEPFFGWLCTFGDGARLTAPESAVAAMREHIDKIAGLYARKEDNR